MQSSPVKKCLRQDRWNICTWKTCAGGLFLVVHRITSAAVGFLHSRVLACPCDIRHQATSGPTPAAVGPPTARWNIVCDESGHYWQLSVILKCCGCSTKMYKSQFMILQDYTFLLVTTTTTAPHACLARSELTFANHPHLPKMSIVGIHQFVEIVSSSETQSKRPPKMSPKCNLSKCMR